MEKKVQTVELRLLQASPDDRHDFVVTVPCFGTPDFHIKADSAKAAASALAHHVYYLLDVNETLDAQGE